MLFPQNNDIETALINSIMASIEQRKKDACNT